MSDVRFVGCEGGERSDAQAIATVHASGRPRRIIDVHAHCAIPAAMALAGAPPIPVAVAGLNDSGDDVATRLAAMDAHGVRSIVFSSSAIRTPYSRQANPCDAGSRLRTTELLDRGSLT